MTVRIVLVFFLMCSATWADRKRVDFSIDASLELAIPSPSPVPEIPVTWDFEVYYDSDSRRYDLFTTVHGDGVHASSVKERAGLGVDDAGQLRGHVRHPLLPDVDLNLKVHPNDFRIDRGPNDDYFLLRPEHSGHSPFAMGTAGRYSTVFDYDPTDVAHSAFIPDGDADGNGIVDFTDFVILSANFERHDSSVTYKDGDFNYDNRINFADFVVLANNFGASGAKVAAVPEPTSAVLLLVALGAAWRFRNRRDRSHVVSV